MWNKITALYNAIDAEQLEVLQHPEALATIAPGYRHAMAAKLAIMPAPERARLLAFSLKYRGRQLWKAVACIVVGASLGGLALSTVLPQHGWLPLILATNVMALALSMLLIILNFSHGAPGATPLQLVLRISSCAMLGALVGRTMAGWNKGLTFLQTVAANWQLIAAVGGGTALLCALALTLMGRFKGRGHE